MFYDLFNELCDKNGVSPSKACLDMGFSRSLAAKWKNTGDNPSADVLTKASEYFGVSTDYLLGKEKSPSAPEATDEPIVIIRRLSKGISKMTPEQHEKMIKILNASFDDLFKDDK